MKEKIIGIVSGFGSGVFASITINWGHIAEKAIETGILAFEGGLLGAAGGLIIAWIAKKYFKITKIS